MRAFAIRLGLAGTALAAGLAAAAALEAQLDFGDDTSRWANDGECDDPRFAGEGAAATLLEADRGHDAADCRALLDQGRIRLRASYENAGPQRGRLERGDVTLTSGEYADEYTFTGTAGQHAVVDLRSRDFDTYLLVRAPSGAQFDNDDFEGDASRSRLSLALTETGTYRITVTSYEKGETGDYTLSIDVGRSAGLTTRMVRAGRLETGDETLTSGEFVDRYEFEGAAGQYVSIDLRSAAFDTYLILRDPAGTQTENDDAADGGGAGHSSIEAQLTEAGAYQVLVTSYKAGESGDYLLTIEPSDGSRRRSPDAREITTLTAGARVDGELGFER